MWTGFVLSSAQNCSSCAQVLDGCAAWPPISAARCAGSTLWRLLDACTGCTPRLARASWPRRGALPTTAAAPAARVLGSKPNTHDSSSLDGTGLQEQTKLCNRAGTVWAGKHGAGAHAEGAVLVVRREAVLLQVVVLLTLLSALQHHLLHMQLTQDAASTGRKAEQERLARVQAAPASLAAHTDIA